MTAAGPESQPPEDLEYLSSGCVIRVADDIDPLLALGHCDALLAVQAVEQTESIALVAAALARGIPVIAPDAGAAPGMITDGSRVAGTLVPLDLRSRIGTDALTAALLRYLTEPTVHEAHCARASAIFQSRFHIEVVAAACLEAYSGALDPLRARASQRACRGSEGQDPGQAIAAIGLGGHGPGTHAATEHRRLSAASRYRAERRGRPGSEACPLEHGIDRPCGRFHREMVA